jgi:hypothetical protein
MLLAAVLALHLVRLTGLDHQPIDINPEEVVTLREPRGQDRSHFSADIKCLIHTADGKIVTVVEDCDTVRLKLQTSK